MQLTMTRVRVGLRPAAPVLCCRRPAIRLAARRLVVRADSDDEMVPIVSGKRKKGFTKEEYEQLRNPKLLGGATIGDELALIRERYVKAEEQAKKQLPSNSNWEGDVYVGSNWNELSILYLIFLLTPLLGLIFAYMTYGTLWATGEFY